MKEQRDNLLRTVGLLEIEKFSQGRPYLLIQPEAEESIMITTLSHCDGLEGDPKLKLYIYIDDNFVYKTRTFPSSQKPEIQLEIDM